jgi:hypothetical protein
METLPVFEENYLYVHIYKISEEVYGGSFERKRSFNGTRQWMICIPK